MAGNIGGNYIWRKCALLNIGTFNIGDIRISENKCVRIIYAIGT